MPRARANAIHLTVPASSRESCDSEAQYHNELTIKHIDAVAFGGGKRRIAKTDHGIANPIRDHSSLR
jgi:uncharacterized protein YifN (PemK superfamily)